VWRFAWALLLAACGFEHGQLGMVRDDAPLDGTRPIDGRPIDGTLLEGLPAWSDIVIEAEDYTTKVDDATYVWSEFQLVAGYSGTGYMQIPGNGSLCTASNIATGCAEMRYSFSIATAGTYHVHARMLGQGSADNSVYWGLDGVPDITGVGPAGDGAWHWVSSGNLSISAGTHSLDIWHREAGTRVDIVAVTMTATPPP
jgi:hypothetical protein